MVEKNDCIIIGAGPVGLFCASRINTPATVFEEHKSVGLPVQCTGIVTQSIRDIVPIKNNVIINKVKYFNIILDRKSSVRIKSTRPNLVIDRAKFDVSLMDLAEKNGAKIFKHHKYISNTASKVKITDLKTKRQKILPFKYLIGTDGPFSSVAKNNMLYEKRKLMIGTQFRAKLSKPIDKSEVRIYPTEGDFAWFLPEDEYTARIGIVSSSDSRALFQKFLKSSQIQSNIKHVIEYQSGVIPYFSPGMPIQNKNVFLAGDSAGMIKNTSSGGLLHGLKAAALLADCINGSAFEKYQKLLKSKIFFDLKLHYYIRNILNSFKIKDWEFLIRLLNREDVRCFLEQYDRDYPSAYIFRMLLAEPRLLYFLKYFFSAF
jgi:digeranylgeranylglycerophospholipid reductase